MSDRPEVWLPVQGFEGFYDVSNHGRIRNCRSGRVLKPAVTFGYQHVTLSKRGVISNMRVHVVVLTAFCGDRPFPEADAAHNDGDKLNCALTNLRWATKIDNQADIKRHGRRPCGEDVFGAKLSEAAVRAIRTRLAEGERYRPLAEEYEVSASTIHLIKHGKIWGHVDG